MLHTFDIDEEFRTLIPPLSVDEFELLEANILEEGVVIQPLTIWDNTIVDGHNRYKIIQNHPNIQYETYQKHFENRYEAMAWICKNQLGRRNLTAADKEYLIGKRYSAEKHANGGDRKSAAAKSDDQIGQVISEETTRKRIAAETGTSEGYVSRAEKFAQGLDIAEETMPGIRRQVLSETIKPTKQEVINLTKAPLADRRQMVENIRDEKSKKEREERREQQKQERQAQKQMLSDIRRITAEMTEDKPRVDEDSILKSMEAVVETMITDCEVFFMDFPLLKTEEAYKKRVLNIFEKPKNYILKIEGELNL